MKIKILTVVVCAALPALLAPAASAQQLLAQQESAFLCMAPPGHVCQFGVQTATGPVNFPLPSGERKALPGVSLAGATYCVCDPGPVTTDCKEPRLGYWCLGRWLDVVPGLNQ